MNTVFILLNDKKSGYVITFVNKKPLNFSFGVFDFQVFNSLIARDYGIFFLGASSKLLLILKFLVLAEYVNSHQSSVEEGYHAHP